MAAWIALYAFSLLVGITVQAVLIYLQTKANRSAPHRSFNYILGGAYTVLIAFPIPYLAVFITALRPYMLLAQTVGMFLYLIGATLGIVGAKLLFDRYVELAKANGSHA